VERRQRDLYFPCGQRVDLSMKNGRGAPERFIWDPPTTRSRPRPSSLLMALPRSIRNIAEKTSVRAPAGMSRRRPPSPSPGWVKRPVETNRGMGVANEWIWSPATAYAICCRLLLLFSHVRLAGLCVLSQLTFACLPIRVGRRIFGKCSKQKSLFQSHQPDGAEQSQPDPRPARAPGSEYLNRDLLLAAG